MWAYHRSSVIPQLKGPPCFTNALTLNIRTPSQVWKDWQDPAPACLSPPLLCLLHSHCSPFSYPNTSKDFLCERLQLLLLPPRTVLILHLFHFPKHKRPCTSSWGSWKQVLWVCCSPQPMRVLAQDRQESREDCRGNPSSLAQVFPNPCLQITAVHRLWRSLTNAIENHLMIQSANSNQY